MNPKWGQGQQGRRWDLGWPAGDVPFGPSGVQWLFAPTISGQYRDPFSPGNPTLQGKLRHGQSAAQQELSMAAEGEAKALARCLLSLISRTQGVGEEKN